MSRWAYGPILTSGREGARWHLTETGPDVLLLSSTSNNSLDEKIANFGTCSCFFVVKFLGNRQIDR